jgi:uncharacterized protein YkwD
MYRASLTNLLLLMVFILLINVAGVSAQSGPAKQDGQTAAIAESRLIRTRSFNRSKCDSGLEKEVFGLINNEREKRGFAPLAWSDKAAEVARLHSENMAEENFFSHRGKDGSSVGDRADRLGVEWVSIGENIVSFWGFEDPARSAADMWMNSKEHKENILNEHWQESGIGAIVTFDGTYYLTQVFLLN